MSAWLWPVTFEFPHPPVVYDAAVDRDVRPDEVVGRRIGAAPAARVVGAVGVRVAAGQRVVAVDEVVRKEHEVHVAQPERPAVRADLVEDLLVQVALRDRVGHVNAGVRERGRVDDRVDVGGRVRRRSVVARVLGRRVEDLRPADVTEVRPHRLLVGGVATRVVVVEAGRQPEDQVRVGGRHDLAVAGVLELVDGQEAPGRSRPVSDLAPPSVLPAPEPVGGAHARLHRFVRAYRARGRGEDRQPEDARRCQP